MRANSHSRSCNPSTISSLDSSETEHPLSCHREEEKSISASDPTSFPPRRVSSPAVSGKNTAGARQKKWRWNEHSAGPDVRRPKVKSLEKSSHEPSIPGPQLHQALGVAVSAPGMAGRFGLESLVNLSLVCRDTNFAVAIAMAGNTDDSLRKKIQEALQRRKAKEKKQADGERLGSKEIISKAAEELSKNAQKRSRQLAVLSERLSGYSHLEMPEFKPAQSPYWSTQGKLMKCVSTAGNWQTLTVNFSDLSGRVLQLKGNKVLAPLESVLHAEREIMLNFSGCFFYGDNGEAFTQILGGNKKVKVLRLRDILCDDQASGTIVSALALGEMSDLELTNCTFMNVQNPLKLLLANSDLEQLTIDRSRLGEDDFDQVGAVLRSHPKLRSLRINNMLCNREWIVQLLTALTGNQCLAELDLSNNFVGFYGCAAKPLENMLSQSHGLVSLNLASTWLDNASARAIGRFLARNVTLTHLNLADNLIGEQGFVSLMRGLRHNKKLEILNMGGKRNAVLSTRAVNSLCNFLRADTHLKELDLSGFYLNANGKARLAAAIGERRAPLILICREDTPYWDHRTMSYVFGDQDRQSAKHLKLLSAAADSALVDLRFI